MFIFFLLHQDTKNELQKSHLDHKNLVYVYNVYQEISTFYPPRVLLKETCQFFKSTPNGKVSISLFFSGLVSNITQAGSLGVYLKNWKVLTQENKKIKNFNVIKGYKNFLGISINSSKYPFSFKSGGGGKTTSGYKSQKYASVQGYKKL